MSCPTGPPSTHICYMRSSTIYPSPLKINQVTSPSLRRKMASTKSICRTKTTSLLTATKMIIKMTLTPNLLLPPSLTH